MDRFKRKIRESPFPKRESPFPKLDRKRPPERHFGTHGAHSTPHGTHGAHSPHGTHQGQSQTSPSGSTARRSDHSNHFRKERSGRRFSDRDRKDTPRLALKKSTEQIPEISAGIIRVIPLGGVEQIGQNMTAVEYGDSIIVIDAGIQFSTEETPGVDYILPNTKYLE